MLLRNRFAASATALAVSAMTYAVVASAKYKFAGDQGVQFLAHGPAGMKINGSSPDLKSEESEGKLVFKASLMNLNTNEPTGLRDKELRKYLEVDKKVDNADPKNPKHDFKNATLIVDSSAIKLPEDGKTSEGNATGKFTLHGVTKDLPFSYKVKRTGSDLHARASFKINIESHGVKKPCLVEVCVKPDVEVKVKFKLREG